MLKFFLLVVAVLSMSCTPKNPQKEGKEEKKEIIKEAMPEIKLEREIADVPQFVMDAVNNAPQDALIGVGSAKFATISISRTTSATRARAEIARQINKVTIELVRNYSIINKTDTSAETIFRETITMSLSNAVLSGVSIIEQDMDDEGAVWTVVMLEKSSLINHINGVQGEAKDAVPLMASFDAETLINESIK
ncbi:MAG: hypothetical protein LBH44_00565 [Treponema sp.]|jgi:hypothetical protein|nr:hypothetical protein [Treponema sp.]